MGCWSCDMQVCASCRYWSGNRNIDPWACHFEAVESEGMCNGPEYSFRGLMMGEGSSCSAWEPFRK